MPCDSITPRVLLLLRKFRENINSILEYNEFEGVCQSIKFCDVAKIMYLKILENTKQLPKQYTEMITKNDTSTHTNNRFPKMERKSSRIIKFSKSHKINGA